MKDKQLQEFYDQLRPTLTLVIALWVIHCIKVFTINNDMLSDYFWTILGVFPREIDGLRGVFLAPLIHANWAHLAANSAPLVVTGVLLSSYYPSIAYRVFGLLYLLTGIAVWIGAREVFHIGASGVVYALVSFLFWSGIVRRSARSVYLSLSILLLYSGMFQGILPNQPGISWESHLYGGIVGIFVAYYFRKNVEEGEIQTSKWEHVAWEKRPYYFSQDVFQYTKIERQRMEDERLRQENEERMRQHYLQQLAQQQQWNSNHT